MRQLFEYDAVLGYRFIPHLKARIAHENGGYLIQTNAAGFRSAHEFIVPKEDSRRRVLLFGDSFTAGDGVSNAKRYGDCLERIIDHLQVYNFGLPGTGTDQQYLAYREVGRSIEHDLIIIAVLVENIRRVAAHYRYYADDAGNTLCFAKPYFELDAGQVVLRNVPVRREPINESELPESERATVDKGGRFPGIRELLKKTGLEHVAHRVARFEPFPEYHRAEDPHWRLLRAVLLEWIRSEPGPVLLMPLPVYYHTEELCNPAFYQQRFAELAAEGGCVMYDPLPDFQKLPMSTRRSFRYERDVHFTPSGHETLARFLAPVVEKLLESPGSGEQ